MVNNNHRTLAKSYLYSGCGCWWPGTVSCLGMCRHSHDQMQVLHLHLKHPTGAGRWHISDLSYQWFMINGNSLNFSIWFTFSDFITSLYVDVWVWVGGFVHPCLCPRRINYIVNIDKCRSTCLYWNRTFPYCACTKCTLHNNGYLHRIAQPAPSSQFIRLLVLWRSWYVLRRRCLTPPYERVSPKYELVSPT